MTGALTASVGKGLAESAGARAAHPPPRVLVATSGSYSETRKTIPITRRARADRRVVMSMSARRLPDLAAGDRLKLTAELQVTIDCHKRAPSCAGAPTCSTPASARSSCWRTELAPPAARAPRHCRAGT